MEFVVEAVLIGCLLITICSLWFMFHPYKNAKKAYEATILDFEDYKKAYEAAKNQYEGAQCVVRGASDTKGS